MREILEFVLPILCAFNLCSLIYNVYWAYNLKRTEELPIVTELTSTASDNSELLSNIGQVVQKETRHLKIIDAIYEFKSDLGDLFLIAAHKAKKEGKPEEDVMALKEKSRQLRFYRR